ncbi:MAG: hypothetical protein LBK53_04235, partial [Heliobacteriaceae bacterium]|nr:hypothetical protein [Heliobacteriaceae bacterium]
MGIGKIAAKLAVKCLGKKAGGNIVNFGKKGVQLFNFKKNPVIAGISTAVTGGSTALAVLGIYAVVNQKEVTQAKEE